MKKVSVGIVCGTRPEIIKLAPVYHALRLDSRFHVVWVHTGQHSDLSVPILKCFNIVPDFHLQRNEGELIDFSCECRRQLDRIFFYQRWNVCIVQGDTESAFLGALTAFYHRIPVAHVEAGLRTYDLESPFPEEGLRQMVSRISWIHFAPTLRAKEMLLREGICAESIRVTGNTVVDAQHWACQHYDIRRKVPVEQGHVLITAHRREHLGRSIEEIFEAVSCLARRYPSKNFLVPLHPNPAVQIAAYRSLGGINNVRLMQALGYLEMQQVLADAVMLLTDSGGLQEEAPTFGIPTIILRRKTERSEALDIGSACVVWPNRLAIIDAVSKLLSYPRKCEKIGIRDNPFGDGRAASRIVEALSESLSANVC